MSGRPKAGILTIGNELLRGSVLNSNACFLGRELTDLGFDVSLQLSCGDVIPVIVDKLKLALAETDLLIVSGGLGPTPDDLTRDALAALLQVPLVSSKKQWAFIQNHYRKRKIKPPEIVKREALFPKNSVPLFNRYGIALGFYAFYHRSLIVVLPGVPVELEKMFAQLVRPLIAGKFKQIKKKPSLVVQIVGKGEPEIMTLLRGDFFDDPFDFGIYPHAGEVTLRLYGDSARILERLRVKIRSRLGDSVYAYENISLSAAVGRLLEKKRQTLAVAESCTGGQLASEITKVPGSSRYFKGGIVAYADEIKKNQLGIDARVLKRFGAVSKPVAALLSESAAGRMKTDYGIGITGIAGPDGGSRQKPVGLVFIALTSPKGTEVWQENFWGDRSQVQHKAVKKALEYLWRSLHGSK